MAQDLGGFGPLPGVWAAGLAAFLLAAGLLMARWQRRLAPAHVQDGLALASAARPAGGAADSGMVVDVEAGQPVAQPPTASGAVVDLPPRDRDFIGRDELFMQVAGALARGPVAVVAAPDVGGIGTSHLALEFAHRGVASGRYAVAWWVRAQTPLTLIHDLAALAAALGAPTSASQQQMIAEVRARLSARDDWLIVLDDVPDAATVRQWAPAGGGDVLITSRSQTWGGLAAKVGVAQFSRAESVALLERRTGESGPHLHELAELLGDLPLALAQASADVDGELSAQRRLSLCRDQAHAGRLLADSAGDGVPPSVATTWLLRFEQLAADAPAGLELLRLLACYGPDDIDVTLLLSQPDLLDSAVTARLAAAGRDEQGRIEAVAAVLRSGLVTRLDDDRVRMHRLVAQLTRHHLAVSEPALTEPWRLQAVSLLVGLMPKHPTDLALWPASPDLAAHVAAAAGHAPPSTAWADALTRVGRYLQSRALHDSACQTLRRAVTINEQAHGHDHPQLADTLISLGVVEEQLGSLRPARATLQRALAISSRLHGPHDLRVALVLGRLGVVEEQLGELETARVTLCRALAIYEAAHGREHPEVAVTLTNLAIVDEQLGDLESARATLRRALAINEETYGPDDLQVAVTLTNLGNVEEQLGEPATARATLQRALPIFEARLGRFHEHTVAVTRAVSQLADLS